MNVHDLWLFIHILLFVFWLGADLGVFITAQRLTQRDLDHGQREFLLGLALAIERTPRVCFVLMFPAGLQLADAAGLTALPALAHTAAWAVSAAWLLLLWMLPRHEGTARGEKLHGAHALLQIVLFLAVTGAGLYALTTGALFPTAWLALKVTLFGFVFLLAVAVDATFKPLIMALGRLKTEGSTPEIEDAIAASLAKTNAGVMGLYALLLAMAFLGVFKPF